MKVAPYLFILSIICGLVLGSTCPNANPNDQIPDDAALQACMDAGGLILLDPGVPGYIINVGVNITKNGTHFSSSAAPSKKATIIAGVDLRVPMIQTVGITYDMSFTYLIIDGNKNARRNVSLLICFTDDPGTNYLTSNLVLPGYSNVLTIGWYSFYPFRYVQNVTIHDVDSINSPCGAGIILAGKDYEVYKCNMSWNGWDGRSNVQKLSFPVADGFNFAVCNNGYIHDNILVDNGNMQIAVGTGRNCRVENNIIKQIGIATINAINVWPTNVWSLTAFWWNPAPWDFMHTTIAHNIITSADNKTAGARTGIAVSSYPWAKTTAARPIPFPVNNAGLIYNNTISGSNINMLVAGVFGGTIWGNKMSAPSSSGGVTSTFCSTSHDYTVGESSGTMLQPGYDVLSYRWNRPCYPTNETIVSTVDNARLTGWSINGIPEPLNISGTTGSAWAVTVSFQNTGTSAWQDFAGGYGYKAGILATTPNWGVTRATLDNAVLYPNSDYTFRLTITLPTTPGNYTIQFQMTQEPVGWFGARSPIIGIQVTKGTPTSTSTTSASTTSTSTTKAATTSAATTSAATTSAATTSAATTSTATTSVSTTKTATTRPNGSSITKTPYYYAYSSSDCSGAEVTQYAKLATGCQYVFSSYTSITLSSETEVIICQADNECNEVDSTCATYQIDQCFSTGTTSAKYSLTAPAPSGISSAASLSLSFEFSVLAFVAVCFLMF